MGISGRFCGQRIKVYASSPPVVASSSPGLATVDCVGLNNF